MQRATTIGTTRIEPLARHAVQRHFAGGCYTLHDDIVSRWVRVELHLLLDGPLHACVILKGRLDSHIVRHDHLHRSKDVHTIGCECRQLIALIRGGFYGQLGTVCDYIKVASARDRNGTSTS